MEAESGTGVYGFLRSQILNSVNCFTGGEGQFFANGYSERIPAIGSRVKQYGGSRRLLPRHWRGLICGVPFYEHDDSQRRPGWISGFGIFVRTLCKDALIDFTLTKERLKRAARLGNFQTK